MKTTSTISINKSPLMGEEGLQRIALWQSVPDEGRRISYADGGQGFRGVFRGVFLFFLFTLLSTLTAGAQDITYYDLWLGDTQVTSANKDNILNQVDADGNPTAKFDPTSNTLTLNNPTISGSARHVDGPIRTDAKILFLINKLTIEGSYHMTEDDQTKYGLFSYDENDEIGFEGDFTFYGSTCGVYGNDIIEMRSGSLKAIGGNYGLYGELDLYDGSLDLEGGLQAINGYFDDFSNVNDGEIIIVMPGGGSIKNYQIYEADGTTIAKHVVTDIKKIGKKYPLWLGSTLVNSYNQDDIFGDGKASFDPTTNTLTLDNPTIHGCYGREKNRYGKIYAEHMDLIIKGSYHMTEAETDDGIVMYSRSSQGCSLTLDGDFTFFGTNAGISHVEGGTITVKSGTLTAVGMDHLGFGAGIFGNSLTIEDKVSYVELQGGITAYALNLYYGGGLHLAEGYEITTPENGIFKNNVIYHSDGTTIATTAMIQNPTNPIQFYDLWVGGKHVNNKNKDDIFGDGNASFNPTTNTLTLTDNPTIAGTTNNSKIYSKLPSLTVTGTYHMTEAETQNGIYSDGPLTLDGDFTFLSKGDWITFSDGHSKLNAGNTLWATGDITLNGNITVQGQDVAFSAIYTENGNITVQGGNLLASANNRCAAWCGGTFTAKGSAESITLEGNPAAIHAGNLVIDNADGQLLGYYEPEDPYFSKTWKSVYSREGNTGILAPRVVLSQSQIYKLWVGGTEVTKDNCYDILGDGKARFNPVTATLTLDNPTISGTTNDCAIYGEWMDLTVKGSANVTTAASCAIKLMYGELTLDGNFTFSGSDYAIWFNRTMKLGQTTEITSPRDAVFMGENTVMSGGTAAKSVTMQNVDRYKIWLGSTQVTSVNKDDIFGDGRASYNPDTQTLTLHDPTISGTYSVGKIFVKDYDLTIRGSYNMSAEEERIGLYASNCTLKLDGNFTFRGSIVGVESDKDITVRGNLKAIGTSTGIHLDNENCVLTLEHGMMTTRVEMTGGQYAMSGGSVSTDATLLIPEGGHLNRFGYIRTVNDEIATEAVLECRYANHGEGTEASPYMIKSKEDWNLLAEDIETGAATSGMYFALVADIKVRKMMGTEQNPFSGTFNGYGCTLTADINENMQGVAPFHTISGATIRNLKVAGTVIGQGYSSGLVGYVKGDGNLIQNCEVSASIGSSGGYNGGFVAHAGSYTTTLDGCVFRGGFFVPYTSMTVLYNGTFVGWDETGAQLTLTRCLDLSKSDPIGRGLTEPTTVTNIYSTFDKSQESGPNLWTTVPQLAYKVTGADVNLTLTGTTGASWNGNLYAAQGETLRFTVNRPYVAFTSTAGTFTQDHEECTLVMPTPGEDVTILNANASSFDIALATVTNGSAVVKDESRAGAVVGIHITPNTYYLLDEVTVTDANNNAIEVEIDGEYGFFTMPNSDVTVSVTFKKQYSFENGVLHLKYGDFNIINRTAFDTDVLAHPENVTKVIADEGVRFTQSCSQLFKDFTGCTEMDLSNVNTAGLVTTSEMFSGCSSLQKLNLTGWETYQINYMNSMFEGCSNLREIDLSGFHVSEGTSMTRMFGTSGISKLTLPAGMAVTKEMELNKGRTYTNTYEGSWSNGTWSYSGWTVLGANGELVSTVEADDNSPNFTYAVIPAPPVAMTFVWKDMPDDFILELPDGQDNSKTIADWNGIRTSVQLTGRKLWKDGDWNTICLPFMLGPSEIISFFGNGTDFRGLDIYSRFNAQDPSSEGDDTDEGVEPVEGEEPEEDDTPYQTGFDETTGTLRLYFTPQNSLTHIMPGEPYIIKWANDTEHPYIESPTFSNVTIDISSNDANVSKTVTSNDGTVTFTGTYGPISFSTADKSVLFLGAENSLYYPDGTSPTTIKPFRAYFQLNGITAGDPTDPSSPVKAFVLNFGDDTETGIVSMDNGKWTMDNEAGAWYTIDGRRVNGKPAQKGIYIHNGRKVVMK